VATKQISVFLENISGRLADVTRILASQEINLRALTIADTADFGILRIIVDETDRAVAVLTKEGFTVRLTDVVALEVPDTPGGLAQVMELFRSKGVNIEYLYSSLEKNSPNAAIILKVENLQHGLKIVEDNHLSIVNRL
jgi:hypothetical protein